MTAVTVVILHAEPAADAGLLSRALGAARARLAEVHRVGFAAAGADRVEVVAGPPDRVSFGARLRTIAERLTSDGGLVILGSGAVPLLSAAGRRTFVRAAAGPTAAVLANNAYSADIVAIAQARSALADVPDLATDNALPRWLAIVSGLISIIGGIVVFTLPGVAIVTFVLFGGWILIAIGVATLFSLPPKKGAESATPVETASA